MASFFICLSQMNPITLSNGTLCFTVMFNVHIVQDSENRFRLKGNIKM